MKIFLFFASALLFLQPAVSEQPRVGRLADGTAYRIDADGFQISDHIAELELTIAELRREVAQLEEQKLPIAKPVSSEDLIAPKQPRTGSDSTKATATVLRNKIRACEAEAGNLRAQTSKLLNDKAALQEQVALRRQESRTAFSKEKKVLMGENSQLQQALLSLQEENQKLLEASGQTSRQLAADNEALKREVASLRNDLLRASEMEVEVVKLSEQLDASRSSEEIAELSAAKEKLERENKRVLALLEKQKAQKASVVASKRASVASKRARLANRSELSASFNKIRGLIQQRKTVLDNVLARNRGARQFVSPLVSSSGNSLDTLRVRIRRPGASAGLLAELEEIQQLLRTDISKLSSL